MITKEILSRLWPNATSDLIYGVSSRFDDVSRRFGLNSVRRIVDFMAQISHESDGGTIKTENLSYSAKRLPEVWPSRFRDYATCRKYAKNPQALGEYVYGGRMGNINPGDGYKYRGRGLLQITGRESYERYGSALGIDLIGNPDLASAPEHALAIAAAEFSSPSILKASDEGNFTRVTKLVNGGTTGLASRQEWRRKWAAALSETATSAPTRPSDAVIMHGDRGYHVKALQDRLRVLGFFNGISDSAFGDLTESAVRRFQRANGLTETGYVDAETQSDLQNDDTSPAPVSEARAAATVSDAADAGHEGVAAGSALKAVGLIGAAGTGTIDAVSGVAQQATDTVDKVKTTLDQFGALGSFISGHSTALTIIGVAVAIFVVGYVLERRGLLSFRAGR